MALPEEKLGLVFGALSAFFFSLMGAGLYQVKLLEPDIPFLVTSFFRIEINLLILIAVAVIRGDAKNLFGDRSKTLWLRGIFGTTSLLCTFFSLRRIGIGEGSFLSSLNAVFIALLAPWVLKQKNSPTVWIAIAGALCGAALMLKPWESTGDIVGRGAAFASGIFSALAYVMIGRTSSQTGKSGGKVQPTTVIFYFCFVATIVHLVLFMIYPMPLPQQFITYFVLVAVGISATFAQYFLTMSYQKAHAALNAAVSYLYPVASMLLQIMLFQERPDIYSWYGAGLILLCGVALPFLKVDTKRAAVKTNR